MTGQKIVILGTGGTIAGQIRAGADPLDYQAAQLGVTDLVAAVPGLGAWPVVVEQVTQIDSKDMDFPVWQRLVERCCHWLSQPDVAGMVITHGTDTAEETAFFLHQVLAPAKPVVLTCAMRPANAAQTDGPQNLLDAVTVVRSAGLHGVALVCAGVIHSAIDVAKVHPHRLDPFSSGQAGPLGVVQAGQVRWTRLQPPPDSSLTQGRAHAVTAAARAPRVEIVLNHAGASGALVQALLAQGVEGLVAAGTGNGTLSQSLQAALLEAHTQGVKVVRSTRCDQGQVMPHAGDLLPHSAGLSPVKARIALMLELLTSTKPPGRGS